MSLIQAALPPASEGTRVTALSASASAARPLGDRMLDALTQRAAGVTNVLGSIQRLTNLQTSSTEGEVDDDEMSRALLDLQSSMSHYMIDNAIGAAIAKQIPATVNALTR